MSQHIFSVILDQNRCKMSIFVRGIIRSGTYYLCVFSIKKKTFNKKPNHLFNLSNLYFSSTVKIMLILSVLRDNFNSIWKFPNTACNHFFLNVRLNCEKHNSGRFYTLLWKAAAVLCSYGKPSKFQTLAQFWIEYNQSIWFNFKAYHLPVSWRQTNSISAILYS